MMPDIVKLLLSRSSLTWVKLNWTLREKWGQREPITGPQELSWDVVSWSSQTYGTLLKMSPVYLKALSSLWRCWKSAKSGSKVLDTCSISTQPTPNVWVRNFLSTVIGRWVESWQWWNGLADSLTNFYSLMTTAMHTELASTTTSHLAPASKSFLMFSFKQKQVIKVM